jgi:hypothetical protein
VNTLDNYLKHHIFEFVAKKSKVALNKTYYQLYRPLYKKDPNTWMREILKKDYDYLLDNFIKNQHISFWDQRIYNTVTKKKTKAIDSYISFSHVLDSNKCYEKLKILRKSTHKKTL